MVPALQQSNKRISVAHVATPVAKDQDPMAGVEVAPPTVKIQELVASAEVAMLTMREAKASDQMMEVPPLDADNVADEAMDSEGTDPSIILQGRSPDSHCRWSNHFPSTCVVLITQEGEGGSTVTGT